MLVSSCHFQKSGLRLPDVALEPATISSNPGSLVFPGCALFALVRPVPPTLAPSLQRSRSVPWPVVLDVQSCTSLVLFRAGDVFPVLCRWVQTNQYCNPIPGSPLWVLAPGTSSLLPCGWWFLPHWYCPQSALDRWCLRLLRPIGAKTPATCRVLSFVPSPTLLHKFQVTPKFPNFPKARSSPNDALSRSRNNRLIVLPLV